MRRALDAIPAEAKASDDAGFKSLIEGVEMTERDMLGALERHGVKRLAPEGERFDPNFHQAMFEIPNPDVPNNTVLQVVQSGYVIGERVLRPAMVGVSKGGPKAGPPMRLPSPARPTRSPRRTPEAKRETGEEGRRMGAFFVGNRISAGVDPAVSFLLNPGLFG